MKKEDCKDDILEPLIKRAISFTQEKAEIKILDTKVEITCPNKIELKKNTAMLGTGGSIQIIITLGYDNILLDKLVEAFLEGDKVDNGELEEIRESVACEVVNIIVGNALKNPINDTVLSITPPILIYEAKKIFKYRNSKIATAVIMTQYGEMLISAIGPKELFVEELEFKEL